MKLGKYLVFVIAGLFFLINGVLFAQETPEQKQVGVTQEKGAERPQFQEKPKIRGYTYNLERLIKEAQENIKKVEAKVTEHFEKGNQLYQEGRLKEARQEWHRALEISQDPEMKNYIREREKRAREGEKKQREEHVRLEKERKEKERLAKETERKKKEEGLAKQKAEQQQRLAEEKAKKEQELKSRQEELARQKEKQLKQIAEEKARREQEGKETKLKEQRK